MIYDVISDVILLYFTNFTTSLPLLSTQFDFYEISVRSAVVQHDQRNNLAKYQFDTMSHFGTTTSFVTSFWSYFTNLITSSPFLKQVNIIFTKCLPWLKLFKMISRTSWTKSFLIQYLVFYLWCHLWRHFGISFILQLHRHFEFVWKS